MHYQDFVNRVQEKIQLKDSRKVKEVLAGVFETLGERLHKTEQEKLAAQLPEELKDLLLRRSEHDFFLLEEFYTRVSARSGVRYPRAVEYSLAVISVLQEAVSTGELADVTADLTEDYRELFGQKEKGPLSPSSV